MNFDMWCYKASKKESLDARNKIFLERGLPKLKENGFVESPFSTSWFGRNNLGDFYYELCRLSENGLLEFLEAYISREDKWIKIFLNIFKLSPPLQSIDQLKGLEATEYFRPINSRKRMRLRSDDYKFLPIFYMLFFPEHKLGCYCTKKGFEKRVRQLGDLIERDMANINRFVKRWHELHEPNVVDWEGRVIEEKAR